MTDDALKSMILDKISKTLDRHDWNYQYSDDHSVWKEHSDNWAYVCGLANTYRQKGFGEQAHQLINQRHQQWSNNTTARSPK